MEVSGKLRVMADLSLQKEPQYPMNRRLGGPQNKSGQHREKNNCLTLPRIEPQIFQPIAQSLY